MTDPYQVLGIPASATDEEVKAAYRRMAKLYHPDRNGGSEEAERKMMQINDAYETIMNLRKSGGRSTQQQGYPYGGYSSPYSSYSQQGYEGAQALRAAQQYILFGQYDQALRILDSMQERSAHWYYLSAQARAGVGDRIAALNHARQAANMEPGNPDYAELVAQLTMGGQEYRSRSVQYGGMPGFCRNPLLTCLLCNCCCGGRFVPCFC